MPRITVFASSSPKTPKPFMDAGHALGEGIAKRGWILVNGAGNTGGMAALSEGCLKAGGRVEGVILKRFQDAGYGHSGLHRLEIAETMRERKRLLGIEADAFVALPGGPGTFEEFWELAVERQIQVHQKPLILLDIDDFYQGFLLQVQRAARDGLLYGPIEELFHRVTTVEAALAALEQFLRRSA